MLKDRTLLPYDLFAELLEYPTSLMTRQTEQLLGHLQTVNAEAAERLQKFSRASESLPLERMKELFTTTFDMQPVCYPYVGFHLFGESYKRGAFMAQLNEAYHARGYSAELELPDHLSVILRFIGLDVENLQSEFCQTLISNGVMPALEKMLKTFGAESENLYAGLLSALQSFLVHTSEKELTYD